MVLACEDSPKLCTGQRSVRLGLARRVRPHAQPPGDALLLDPFSEIPLSSADTRRARASGVVAVDCSWNRLSKQSAFPALGGILRRLRARRRLPLLLAANPQHYGRVGQLNTGEALGAAVFVLFGEEQARRFLERFSFGPSFLSLNAELLEGYRAAGSGMEITRLEKGFFSRSGTT